MEVKPETGDASDAKDATDVSDASDARDATDALEVSDASDAKDAVDATDGETSDVVTPVCPATPVCVLTNKRCGPGGGTQTCITVSGCPDWSTETACGTHQTCGGAGVCGCNTAPAGCTAAGTFCDANGAKATCAADAQGCFFISVAAAACPTNQSCTGTLPAASCTCNNTNCAAMGTSCLGSDMVRTCTPDTSSLHCLVASETACPSVQTCQGTSPTAACACPMTGVHQGDGCTLQALPICDSANILTCTHDDPTGCNTWQITDPCGADASTRPNNPHPAGLTCGSKAGHAACQCPEMATTSHDVYVDPAIGADTSTSTNPFPTGIKLPAVCRFGTLKMGLGVTGVANVIAINDAVEAGTSPSATFAAETSKLVVPTFAVLTTASPADASHYKIGFGDTSGNPSVQLSDGSTIKGFTIFNSGNASEAAAAIATPLSGTVTIDNVAIKGNAATTIKFGVNVLGGTATLTNVNVDQLKTSGVEVTNSATVNETGGSLTGTPIGLHVQSGTVTATNVTIDGDGFGVLIDGGSPAVKIVGGNITNSTSAGIAVSTAGKLDVGPATTINGHTASAGSPTSIGMILSSGTTTLTGTTVKNNVVGITSSGAGTVVVIDGASAIDSNLSNGIVASNLGSNTTPGLTVTGGTSVGLNGGDGIVLSGAIANINGVNIHENTNGIHVSSPTGAAVIQVGKVGTTTQVQLNRQAGILADQAPETTAGSAASLVIDSVSAMTNGGSGILLNAATAAHVFAAIRNSTISNNVGTGVIVAQTGTGHTDSSFNGNKVFSNGFTGSTDSVGGILFSTPSTLSGFVGNTINDNNGNQLAFNAIQVPDVARSITTTWKISSSTCDMPPSNAIYHYNAGVVGLRVAGPVTVDASNVHWQNASPQAGTDVSTMGTINFEPHCTKAP
jgi:hypothetical protein